MLDVYSGEFIDDVKHELRLMATRIKLFLSLPQQSITREKQVKKNNYLATNEQEFFFLNKIDFDEDNDDDNRFQYTLHFLFVYPKNNRFCVRE